MENRELFLIDKDGLLIINKIEARQIKMFREILQRDKGSKGDFDGKKKFQSFKEFMYIYLVASPKSIYRDLGIDERKKKARKDAKLEDDWKETVLIKEAISKYEESLKLSGSEYAYYNASRAMYSIGKDLDLFNTANIRTRRKIGKIQLEIEADDITPDELESKEYMLDKLTEALSKNTQEIVKLSSLLPKAYKSLEDLYDKMMKDIQEEQKLYGGGEIGRRED